MILLAEPSERRATEFAELLTECAELSLTLTRKRQVLEERLETLGGLTQDLEGAVAEARVAIARGREFDSELDALRRLQTRLRQELPARAA